MENHEKEPVNIVPWISMAEWKEVYKQIYSNKLEYQEKAYESLRVWKSRKSHLPQAVECTLLLLHVHIKDQKNVARNSNNNNNEQDFGDIDKDYCMMYCTAVTRCLNQILQLDPRKSSVQSMFMVAKGLNIPSWVVQLRHDASHGLNLPSLASLRHCTQVLLAWLHENYWSEEGYNTYDWLPGSELATHVSKLVCLLDTWQSVHLYVRANFRNVGQIPERSLKSTLLELRAEYLSGTPRSKDLNTKNWKLKHALVYLKNEIISLVTKKSHAEQLASIVVESKGFIVSHDVFCVYIDDEISPEEEVTSLPRELVNQWKDILCLLHCAQVLPALITRLIEICTRTTDKFQCNIAALWLKELSLALLKLQKVQVLLTQEGFIVKSKLNLEKYIEMEQKNSSSSDNRRALVDNKLFAFVQSKYPELSSALRLPTWVSVPSSTVFCQHVYQASQNPTSFNLIYLPSLLELLDARYPQKHRQELIQLMSIYCGRPESLLQPSNGIIHTLAEISEHNNITPETQCATHHLSQSSDWTLYSGEWIGCALGQLPWQQDLKPADFILSETWIPYQSDDCTMEASSE